jgi:hypothetical protein
MSNTDSQAPTGYGSRFMLAVVGPLLAGAAALCFRTRDWVPYAFSPSGVANIGQTLAPLVMVAAFIERAVEVVITAWRDEAALRLQHAADKASTPEDVAARKHDLDLYKLQTQRHAFTISLAFALIAAIVGVRAVTPLIAATADRPANQQLGFAVFEVLLTALLLAGGSDGIHQLVTTVTQFLDSTKDKTKS